MIALPETQNTLLVKRVAKLAEAKGCTPGQLALAWVLAQGDDVIPIPGAALVYHKLLKLLQ